MLARSHNNTNVLDAMKLSYTLKNVYVVCILPQFKKLVQNKPKCLLRSSAQAASLSVFGSRDFSTVRLNVTGSFSAFSVSGYQSAYRLEICREVQIEPSERSDSYLFLDD